MVPSFSSSLTLRVLPCLIAALTCLPVAVQAAEIGEVWRGGFKEVHSVAVNPTDGSCWVADLYNVIRLAPDGTQLWRKPGFNSAASMDGVPFIVEG
jgi:hypothetical protein